MAGLFDNLALFFEGLFSSDPEALRAKRQLRELVEVLQEITPPVYSPRGELVLPGFAQSWGTVHALLQPFRDLFDKTLSHKDRKIQEMSLAYLIEGSLTGEITDRRLAFSYEAIKDRLLKSPDLSRESTSMTTEFTSLIADLRKQDSDKLQKSFEALYRLKVLTEHSLVPLLTRFGYDAASTSQHFRAVEASNVATELLDLYFVVEGLDLGPGLELLLGLLLEKVSPQKAPENRRKTGTVLDRLRDLRRGPCSPQILLHLVRVTQNNPDAQPEVQRYNERYLQTYSNTLSDRFARDRDRALQEQSDSTLESDIASLFPGTPLLPLSFYNADSNTLFTDMGLPTLSAVKPLQILRSFCFAVLKTGYLDAVKKVVLNGFFSDKDWGEKFADALYAAEEILTRLETFDQDFETDSKWGLPSFEKYLSGKAPVSSVAKALTDKLNRTAMALLEEEAKVLNTLALRVQEVLSDYKSPQPQYVGNIKGLGGKDQRAMVEMLINGYNKTAQLLRILKYFIVVK